MFIQAAVELWLMGRRVVGNGKVAFVYYMSVTEPSETVEKNLSSFCDGWSTSGDNKNAVSGRENGGLGFMTLQAHGVWNNQVSLVDARLKHVSTRARSTEMGFTYLCSLFQ